MKNLIQEDKATEILSSYLPIIKSIMVDSLNTLNNGLDAMGMSINNRAKTSTLHSIAVSKIKTALSSNPDIDILEKYQSIQIVFKKQIVGRIKKVNKKNMSSNSKTNRNNLIQSQQLSLFSLPEITYVDFGYDIDPAWMDFEKLIVVCRVNENEMWNIPFNDANMDVTIKSQPISITPKEETQIKIKKLNG